MAAAVKFDFFLCAKSPSWGPWGPWGPDGVAADGGGGAGCFGSLIGVIFFILVKLNLLST